MHNTKRTLGRLLAAMAMAVAMTAIAASSASAYGWALGNFSPDGPYVQQAKLQLSFAGQTKQCNFDSTHNQPLMNGSGTCLGGGTLSLAMVERPVWWMGAPTVSFSNWCGCSTPWGTLTELGFSVPVVNGNQSNPTKLVFTNTTIGYVTHPQLGRTPVNASGAMTIKTTTGGLVTVTP